MRKFTPSLLPVDLLCQEWEAEMNGMSYRYVTAVSATVEYLMQTLSHVIRKIQLRLPGRICVLSCDASSSRQASVEPEMGHVPLNENFMYNIIARALPELCTFGEEGSFRGMLRTKMPSAWH